MMLERDWCSHAVKVYDELSVACPLTPHPRIRNSPDQWNVKEAQGVDGEDDYGLCVVGNEAVDCGAHLCWGPPVFRVQNLIGCTFSSKTLGSKAHCPVPGPVSPLASFTL